MRLSSLFRVALTLGLAIGLQPTQGPAQAQPRRSTASR